MLKFLIIAIGILVLFTIALISMPIVTNLKTMRDNEDDLMIIQIKTMYGIINMKFEVPMLDIVFVNNKPALKYKAEIESNRTSKLWKKVSKVLSINDINHMREYFKHDTILYHRLTNYWLKKLFIHDLSIVLKYGTSDAAFSALIYGAAWTILGALLTFLKCHLNLTTKDILVTPWFDKEGFNLEFSCIIKFKFGNIINTGIMVLKRRRELSKQKASSTNSLVT